MKFTKTDLEGVCLIDLDKKEDERGFFARSFCKQEWDKHGLISSFPQMNTSFNKKAGTIRGMHFRYLPYAEVKMVRCFSGAISDVILDVRPDSPTFGKHIQIELSSENRTLLYIPAGFAHGFQTLTNNVELLYWHSEFYNPLYETGVRFDDPILGIQWPLTSTVVSEKDNQLPFFNDFFQNNS